MQLNKDTSREQNQTVIIMSALSHFMQNQTLEGARILVNMPDDQSLQIEGN